MYRRLVKSFHNADLLTLEAWLREILTLVEVKFLLDTLDDCYDRMSTMPVSQFPIPICQARFPDLILADVILDHLVHNAHYIEILDVSQRKIRA